MNIFRKAIYLCFLLSYPIAFHSCTTCTCQKVTCGRYSDPKMDEWINGFYSVAAVFQNSTSAKDTFFMPSPQKSDVYEAQKGCVGADPGCMSTLMLYSDNLTSTGRRKFLINYRFLTGWDNSTSKQIALSVHDLEIVADNISDTGFVFLNPKINTAFSSSITIAGRTFLNVQRLQADTSVKGPNIYKIYFAKNLGLVAYEEYPSKKVWVRQ